MLSTGLVSLTFMHFRVSSGLITRRKQRRSGLPLKRQQSIASDRYDMRVGEVTTGIRADVRLTS